MKNLLLLISLILSSVAMGQAPAEINYQGIARNAVGNVLPQKNIAIRLSVHDANGTGPILYQEVRKITTSNLGMFNIAIGSPGATAVLGSLAAVPWESGLKFLQVELDANGGSSFTDMGTGQLLSVPYAMYAERSKPVGAATGDLTGNYPNPALANGKVTTQKVADGAISTMKIQDSAVTLDKIAPGVIPLTLPPSGIAEGDLSGTYPNPKIGVGVITSAKIADDAITTAKLADNSISTDKISDASITAVKLAPGVIPTSLAPNGAAGGELSGSYPNPEIASGVITSAKLADNAVTTVKITDASVTSAKLADNAVTTINISDASVTADKLAPGVIPTSIPVSGTAGGELTGTYPNPQVAAGVITSAKLADNAVTTVKITDASVTSAKLADNAVTTINISDASVTADKLAPGVIPTSIPVSGTAGGELTGTYPNPQVAAGVITSAKLADNAVTTVKITDASVTSAKLADNAVTTINITDASITADKLAPGVIPTSLPVNGTAGGELIGTYPNPQVAAGVITSAKLADNAVTTVKITDASVTSAKLADNAVTTINISDASVTADKLAPGVIPTSLPINGTAGGELTGTYPNPQVAAGVITSAKLADNAVTTVKITDASVTTAKLADNAVTTINISDASVTADKLAPGVIPTSLPVNGTAGGELIGTYPNPQVAVGVITSAKLADNAVTTVKITDASVTTAKLADNAVTTINISDASVTADKLAPGVIPTSLPINGTAGGELTGTYPNPQVAVGVITSAKLADNAVTTVKITDASVTAAKLAPGVIPTSFPASGAAGGELTGTYPNPQVAAGVITSGKLANNAVTTSKITDASVTLAKLAPGVIPTALPPIGLAGGELTGSYPNPSIATGVITTDKVADNAITTAKVMDASITMAKLGPDVVFGSGGSPSGSAGGDLSGNYPNPNIKSGSITIPKIANGAVITPKLADEAVTTQKIANDAITTEKVLDGSITLAKLAPGVIPAAGSPTGAAGGDLAGTYPNPTIVAAAINTTKLADNAITTSKIVDASVTAVKLAAGVIPTSLPPTGTAGGDLAGTYPNPTIGAAAINTAKLADNTITTSKIVDASVTAVKLAAGVIPTSLPPTGTAGGDLAGTYPNPTIGAAAINTTKLADNAITTSKIVDASVTAVKLAAGVIPTSLPPTGTAGGDLAGTYPNPTIGAAAINTAKLADNAITTNKILDASVTAVKLAAGVIPTSLPPTGTAGGDLAGTYPNPSISKIKGIALSSTAPATGQILKYNGTVWTPASDSVATGLTLPYAGAATDAGSILTISNNGTGAAIEGINATNNNNAVGVLGTITALNDGINSAGVRGVQNNQGANGFGIWGSHSGTGSGVFGSSVDGVGLHANSTNNQGLYATSENGTAGYFDAPNFSGMNEAIVAYNVGYGTGLTAISEGGNGIWGVTYSPSATAILGYNVGGGEGVVGRSISNTAAGVVGRTDGSFAGVQGIGAFNGGVGVLALVNVEGYENGTALVAEIEGGAAGNTAVFKAAGANVARIDHTGKAFFNGGSQVGGADVAEFFQVDGNRSVYEPGDVLVISTDNDRSVAKSNSAYSTLVAGVYATKPGLLLTEENAEKDQLEQMVPMGVIGVIPTKVCLEGGAIKRGDLIVTSSQTGVAMKADLDKVKTGQVIGKALQEFNGSGTGKINILVSVK